MKKPPLYRKADRYEPHRCVVEKAVAIPHAEFEQMRLHPVRDITQIKEFLRISSVDTAQICSKICSRPL